jgi:hypothetical protein
MKQYDDAMAQVARLEKGKHYFWSFQDVAIEMIEAEYRGATDIVARLLSEREAYSADINHFERSDLAFIYASLDQFSKAFFFQRSQTLDDFLIGLCKLYKLLEHKQTGIAMSILEDCTRILGWIRPDWKDVHKLIMTVSDNEIPII